MNPSQRIVFNTAAAYTRSMVGAGLALFSARWVLNALGQTDFGLFSVVGVVIIFITFLNGVMAASAGRHFAFAVGQGKPEEVNRWFNAALSIHLFLAIALIIVGWPIGEYAIAHILTIPTERVTACRWVFRISLISAFVSMVSIPFVAMFTAMQRITVISAWGILYSIMTFVLAWFLLYAPGDRLIFYAAGMVVILVIVQSAQIIFAMAIFSECKIIYKLWFDRYRVKEIYSFASWILIGSFGGILRDHGSAILLNLQFGPKINAAYSIANQVSAQTNQLTSAMLGALSPEITGSEGRGDRKRMLDLAQRASKFGTILVMLFAIPLIAEIDYILTIWLRIPPPHTALFCQLILATYLLDRLSAGYMLAVQAHGRIAAYQATLGIILVLTLPIAWVFLRMGSPPTSVGIAFVVTMVAVSTGRVFWVRRLLGVPVSRWLKVVVFPSTIVAIAAIAVVTVPRLLLSPSPFRLVITTVVGITTILVTTWFLALGNDERRFAKQNIRCLAIKMGIKFTD